MAVTLDGIASGLDTAELISSLMAVEAMPQTLLKARVEVAEAKITDFQSLNTQIAALATLAAADSTGTALQTLTATSSSTAATAVADGTAAAGSIDFTVSQLAQAQTSVTAAMGVWPQEPAVLTVVGSDGAATQITASSTSITDIVTAINAAGAGITATKVAAGTAGDGTTQYRLQLTSTSTGEDGAFSVYRGTSAEVDAGTATDLLAQTGAATIRVAQDARLTLWAGTAAEQSVSSASNTFTDLLEGVDVTVSAVSAAPVSLTLALDPAAATAVAQAAVDALSTMLGFIDTKSSTTTEKDTSGNTVTTLGSFTSDSTIRSVRQSIMSAVSAPVDGVSPATIGISFDSNGSIEFDADVFAAALAADPETVGAMFATIASRVAAAASAASDDTDGTLTLKIEGQQTLVDNYSDQVDDWDDRLAAREATLKATFVALEVSMSSLNAQSSYLTSQLASLPTWDSSDN
jgi:flagellar hook-associated protein 2